ncbi:unnamed protein product [Effrenium voratum]|uniref:S1 motif domain-containing protein n=1 Tax=Effrenium voratum TaxID=2562239 RepID=A0AA36HP10_9DINO|nr:unnamed protein product [Effrenium voratum]
MLAAALQPGFPQLPMPFARQSAPAVRHELGPLRVTGALYKNGLLKGGKVLIITSQAGSVEWRFTQNKKEGGDYGHHMSRAACNIGAVLMSEEMKEAGIPVTLVHPGFNRTEMTSKFGEEVWEKEGAVDPAIGAKRVLHEAGWGERQLRELTFQVWMAQEDAENARALRRPKKLSRSLPGAKLDVAKQSSIFDADPGVAEAVKSIAKEVRGRFISIQSRVRSMMHMCSTGCGQARAFLATAGRARTQISRPALQEEAEEEPWDPDSIEVLPTEMKQLRVGQELQGVVTRVTDRIALVSVGVEKDGLLPASKLAEGRVDNVQDQLKQGDMIQVWVAEVELGEDIRNSKLVLAGHKNKIVSLYQFGNQSSIDDLEAVYNKQEAEAAEVWYDAMVTGVKEFGVIVAFRVPGVPGIASGLVYKPGAEESGINVLDKVKVRISGVDRSKGRGRLQLRMDGAGRADRAAVLSEFKEIIGQTLEGEVVDFADFGAFVQAGLR